MKIYILYLLLGALLSGCGRSYSSHVLEDVIRENPQLQEVLKRYEADTLKLRAAEFLIMNLPYYYSFEGEQVEHYRKQFELFGTGLYTPGEVQDSIRKLYGHINLSSSTFKSDMELTPDFLIDNIEWAFKVREEQPWGKYVPFDDFCEYVLPYRIADEPLKPWREKVYNAFNPILDSVRALPEAQDPLFVSRVLIDSISRIKFHFTGQFEKGPHVGPDLVDWHSGNCRETADMLIYIFRALGIPCGCDYMPLRGDANVAHFWNFILDKDGESYYMYENGVIDPVRKYWGIKSKIYRQTFSRNEAVVQGMRKEMEAVPLSLRFPNFIDVTRLYSGKYARVLNIPREKLFHEVPEEEVVYLCSPMWMDWLPMAWAHPAGNDVSFADVEGGVIFRLCIYDKDGRLVPVSDPFVFDRGTGGVHYFEASDETEEIKLLNKYHQFIEPFAQRMVGGVFEGSNRADFLQKDTLYAVLEPPVRLYSIINLNNAKSYRYVRYIGPENGHCNISEVAFYETPAGTSALRGRVIGTSNGTNGDGGHDYLNVYDGDPYTSFDYYQPTGGWSGLDLGRPYPIRKIIFTPRNRDNYVRKGDVYELFYSSQGEWISIGKQLPPSDSLLYTVPKGALLYLKNHTRGSDERIFEYDEGKQRYW
ncbi:discoidin domain-containing protein [Bacteroides sp. UBA939]|uniref:discoidin domain-containing protein n=1 Tax=Bacteroides sp. UBA939 TaxID=1946092 RepID=UPI0025BF98F1|nr:discoidin domain-containing protein [Bacteroides sp. UBA939]